MSHAVDGHGVHCFFLRVVLVGLGVQVAVGAASGEVTALIAQGNVDTIGLGIFHVLVLAHTDGVVLGYQVARCRLRRNGDEGNHVVHLIDIGCDGHGQVADAVFRTRTVVVGVLGLQSVVAEIEVHAIHIFDILVVQLLRCRRLVALAPRSTQAQVAQLQHGRNLGRQSGAEAFVTRQSQASREIQRIEQSQLVLDVDGLGIVRSLAARHTHRRLQPVVAVFESGRELLLVREREDALQRDVRQPLVALQFGVAREIGEVVGEASVHVTIRQRGVRIGITVGVALPVCIEGNDVRGVQLPFASDGCRGIVVLQVPRLHVHTGMVTAGPVDALPVDAAVGIEFYLGRQLVGQALGQLPVGMAVDGLVARVGDVVLRLLRRFLRCVLPAVRMLQLEVSIAGPAPVVQGHSIVLTNVAV